MTKETIYRQKGEPIPSKTFVTRGTLQHLPCAFISELASCMEAYEYYINDQKTHFWEEAEEHCKQNGSILAVLDTQDKLDELSRRLASQSYKKSDQFWIGLVFNASSRQFMWSSGATVNATAINTTCDIIQNEKSFHGKNWCFLLKNVKSNSHCFYRKACDKRLPQGGAGYICQPTTQKGIYSQFSYKT